MAVDTTTSVVLSLSPRDAAIAREAVGTLRTLAHDSESPDLRLVLSQIAEALRLSTLPGPAWPPQPVGTRPRLERPPALRLADRAR